MRKNVNMIIFIIISYLLTLSIVRASAYESLAISKYDPSIVENSMFIKIAANR